MLEDWSRIRMLFFFFGIENNPKNRICCRLFPIISIKMHIKN